jgi:uncharacterized protein (DUF488 family)
MSACQKVGISYVHMPELGISPEYRQGLENQKDYDRLFTVYEKSVLPAQAGRLIELKGLVESYGRVAITCFEANERQCHRGRVAKALSKLPGWNAPVTHL